MEVAVDIFTGFIGSGKTTLMKDIIKAADNLPARILLIRCEKGQEQWEESFLKEYNIDLVEIPKEKEFSDTILRRFDTQYRPELVLMEYNGTWGIAPLLEMNWPPSWKVEGRYTTVDGSTANLYLTNMRTMLLEQMFQSDLIVVNRCNDTTDCTTLRRTIKMQNLQAQILFEKDFGIPLEMKDEELPYSIEEEVITIDSMDYGIWYVDAIEHPEHYLGKKITFLAQVYKTPKWNDSYFIPGRFVMTCCEADIKFLGFLCRIKEPIPYETRDFVQVVVSFSTRYSPTYQRETPLLTLQEMRPAMRPTQDLVTLN